MPSRRLVEVLLGIEAGPAQGEKTSGLTEDVLASLIRRSLLNSFEGVMTNDAITSLLVAVDLFENTASTAVSAKDEISKTVYQQFQSISTMNNISFDEFELRFSGFLLALKSSIDQARAPKLMEMPCRDFGELDLDELSKMQVPEDLSSYMMALVKRFEDRHVIQPVDANHVIELIEKMAGAPGYLRFLSKEKKHQEVIRLFSIVRDIQSSGICPDLSTDDLLVSLGLLLFNINPSEKIAAYLSSLRPSNKSNALLYHYNSILSLNSMLAGQMDMASAYAASAFKMAADHQKMAYVLILQGCITIRQGDYEKAIHILEDASILAPLGRLKGLVHFYRGTLYFEKKEYANAVKCFEAAGGQVSDSLDLVVVHSNIGSCAMYLGDMARAEQAFSDMEKLSGQLGGEHAGHCLLVIHSYMGTIWRDRGDNKQAVQYFKKALNTAISSNDRRAVANQLGNLGISYGVAGDSEKAIQLLNSCMAYSERMGYWAGIKFAYWHIRRLLDEKGNESEASKFVDAYTSRYPELKDLP